MWFDIKGGSGFLFCSRLKIIRQIVLTIAYKFVLIKTVPRGLIDLHTLTYQRAVFPVMYVWL